MNQGFPSGTFSVTVWNGTGVTNTATIGTEPTIAPTATFTYNGPLDFINNTYTADTFSEWGLTFGSISNFTSSETLNTFLGSPMSTTWVNTYMLFTGTYSTPSSSPVDVMLSSDDGSSLYYDNNGTWVTAITSPGPQAYKSTPGTIMGGTDVPFKLTYVETDGAPADLQLTVTPEPATLLLMGSGMLLIGLISLKRLHAGENL